MIENQKPKVYRAREISKLFGVSIATVWNYARDKKIHPKKITDGITVFNAKEIHTFFGVEA